MADLSRQVETRVIRSWKFWIGCALLAGLIWLVEANFGWNRIAASWAVIPPQQLAVAIALMAASYLLRALRFYDFFYQWTQGRFGALLRITVLHNFFNNLLPMRSGEAAFPILMKQTYAMPISHTGPALLWLRLLDLYALLALGFIFLQSALPYPTELKLVLAGLVLLSPITALLLQERLRTYLRAGTGWKARAYGLMTALPGSPTTFLRAIFWTLLNWLIKLAVFSWLLSGFTGLTFVQSWSGATTGELSSVLPIHGIAGAGTYEAGVAAGLLMHGVSGANLLAASVNLHLFVLGSMFLLTGVFVLATQRVEKRNNRQP
ncbi:lysylphosphatidylglycerol synthase transmembrane domain-containing protein [Thalassolituus sp.]|jgi:uncharacterized membrane protein YbhN (UPF0104 family)|uniref:lysylphosphatidylglycerol synthase transmembrane domain-containing protein n=1 Tax=Thalassolituus sp. TaxID=2030822 RepID=UPI003512D6B9